MTARSLVVGLKCEEDMLDVHGVCLFRQVLSMWQVHVVYLFACALQGCVAPAQLRCWRLGSATATAPRAATSSLTRAADSSATSTLTRAADGSATRNFPFRPADGSATRNFSWQPADGSSRKPPTRIAADGGASLLGARQQVAQPAASQGR
jgi:hypothetical protein